VGYDPHIERRRLETKVIASVYLVSGAMSPAREIERHNKMDVRYLPRIVRLRLASGTNFRKTWGMDAY